MLVIVPACGRGERFKNNGYDVIKPLIPVLGRPMIDAVVGALCLDSANGDKCVVVTNFDGNLNGHHVVSLSRGTVGATETVLLALESMDVSTLDSSGSLLLIDCDAIYHCDVIGLFQSLENQRDIRAAVLCFEESAVDRKSSAPKYSYVMTNNEDSDVTDIAEKVRVGPYANTGAYWFASAAEFCESAKEVVSDLKFEKGEAYVSCVLKEYILRGKRVTAVVISENQYSNVGSPECLEAYLSQQGHAFLFDLDGTLVDTTAAYVSAWSELLESRGAYVDEEFFLSHISGRSDKQVSERFNITISSKEKDERFLRHISSVNEIPGAVEFVRMCCRHGLVCVVTNSNRLAAKALLKKCGLDELPLVSSDDCNNGKPNAEPYNKAARLLGVSMSKCIVFEDSRTGMVAARAAGCNYVVSVHNNLHGSDTYFRDYVGETPEDLLKTLNSVAHLSEELSWALGQRSIVYPVRASGGYISEILSATSGTRRLVVKQENSDHGVLTDVSKNLHLHETECVFYEDFARTMPVRVPICYGILPQSRAIIMEDLRKFDRAPIFDLESGLKVVKTVAKMHSHFRGAPLGRLSAPSSYMRHHVVKNYATFRARWSSTLREEVLGLFDHAVENIGEAESQLLRVPQTLLHGDLKFPNLFWDNNVSGGEPIFIDWQYARPGQGIEDIVFLIIESCDISQIDNFANILVDSYYEARQREDDVCTPNDERSVQVSSALTGFPLFVAVWFGCIDATKLSEPNFPFLYILRLAKTFELLYNTDWHELRHISARA